MHTNSIDIVAHYNRIIVKIGSNVLTRPDGTLDVTRMSALVDQVADLHRQGIEVVMVSSGAVASGRGEMRGDRAVRRHLDAVSARQLYSAVGQAKLINRYYELFREHGIVCGQVLTTKEDFATRHQYLNQKHCMEVMIDNGVIPVVNENDTTSVTELMFTDNDELSGLIAAMMGAQALVLLSNVDGVYDGDPADPSSSIIREIAPDEKAQADPVTFISKSKSSLGRGGMGSKFRTASKVASEGIAVYIANGRRDGILQAIVAGGNNVPCTLFTPAMRPVSGMKKWIAHSDSFAKGAIHVNRGAYEALTSSVRATSLLPVGVTQVEGEFEKDDIVKIISPAGEPFAMGRVCCDSATAAARAGTQGSRPLIHYDYLYIEKENG